MKFTTIKFVFFIIFGFNACWSLSVEDELSPSYVRKSIPLNTCENDVISLNFSNAVITDISRNFISSPLITCLNMAGNHIKNIERGAFNKLPNLIQLFLSDNNLKDASDIFNFGGHDALQVFIINNAVKQNDFNLYTYNVISISDKYPNLKILSLKNNSIRDLLYTIPYGYNRSIPFPKLEMLDLSENCLSNTNFVYNLLSSSLQFLDLHNNSIRYFSSNIFNKLITLNLNNNNIIHIIYITLYEEYGKFSLFGMTNLQYVSVSNNHINIIESNAFQDNYQLLYLNLSRNRLDNLNAEIFFNLPNLQVLDLSENNCLESFPKILSKMQITILYLNSNCIRELTPQIFVNLPKLTKLLLGDNMIEEINVTSFDGLSILEELDLSKNLLNFLPEGWTESLVSLKYLDLSNNKFTSLESLSLTYDLWSLMEVYIMMNPVEYLNVSYLKNLPQNLTINLINKSSFAKWNNIDHRYQS